MAGVSAVDPSDPELPRPLLKAAKHRYLATPATFIRPVFFSFCGILNVNVSAIILCFLHYSISTMKSIASSLLVGGCLAVTPVQQVLQAPQQATQSWTKPFHDFQNSLKSLTNDARAVWDEVAMLYPGAMDKARFFSPPKKHTRRPDSHWDHIIRGADVQSVWVENEGGEKERELDGKLEAYDLRTKKVDPSALGVDPEVKQLSGYLDDNENDKHLFYCECNAYQGCFVDFIDQDTRVL